MVFKDRVAIFGEVSMDKEPDRRRPGILGETQQRTDEQV